MEIGTPVYWLVNVMDFILALVSMAIEGRRDVFSLPVCSTSERMMQTLGLTAAPGNLAFAMVLSEY